MRNRGLRFAFSALPIGVIQLQLCHEDFVDGAGAPGVAGAAVGGGIRDFGEGGDAGVAADALSPGAQGLVHAVAVAELSQCLQDIELEVERTARDILGVSEEKPVCGVEAVAGSDSGKYGQCVGM